MPKWEIEQTSKGCYLITMEADSPDWTADFLLRSDAHHDNDLLALAARGLRQRLDPLELRLVFAGLRNRELLARRACRVFGHCRSP